MQPEVVSSLKPVVNWPKQVSFAQSTEGESTLRVIIRLSLGQVNSALQSLAGNVQGLSTVVTR
jgi:hypothetical protein